MHSLAAPLERTLCACDVVGWTECEEDINTNCGDRRHVNEHTPPLHIVFGAAQITMTTMCRLNSSNLSPAQCFDTHNGAVTTRLQTSLQQRLKTALSMGALMGLLACSAPPELPPPATFKAQPVLEPDKAKAFVIDPTASMLHILVYRGGSMARLGHNHVISSRSLRGTLWRGDTLTASGFDIVVPVAELIVDDDATRAQEGEDFPLNISEDAKSGTKANMLRATLLDGAQYPEIKLRSVAVSGHPESPLTVAAIQIKNQIREVQVPVRLIQHGCRIEVQGAFDLRQSDFGITPLSIALGALQVVDAVKIKFRLVALATNASACAPDTKKS